MVIAQNNLCLFFFCLSVVVCLSVSVLERRESKSSKQERERERERKIWIILETLQKPIGKSSSKRPLLEGHKY